VSGPSDQRGLKTAKLGGKGGEASGSRTKAFEN
jgi:hypothetical protein